MTVAQHETPPPHTSATIDPGKPYEGLAPRRIAAASIGVAVLVMAIKYAAWLLTGSVALYSDALESIVNVIAAVIALVAISISARPADQNHPFGHAKAELVSAAIEGALIIVAALLIIGEAYAALIRPRTIDQPLLGLLINGGATALNAAWAAFLIRSGARWRSPALTADGWHILTDVWTSLGVIGGIAVAAATGWSILDPLIAIAVAINILWMGWGIVSGSVGGLMDNAAPKDVQESINRLIRTHGEGALQAHDIRTRRAGHHTFIAFHLVVPGTMSVVHAHEICDRIETAIEAEIPDTDVVIHVEPDHKAKDGAKGLVDF
jgi:cation diffusion facilitator family transporter